MTTPLTALIPNIKILKLPEYGKKIYTTSYPKIFQLLLKDFNFKSFIEIQSGKHLEGFKKTG